MLDVSGRLGHKVKVMLLRKAQKLYENKAVCYFKILLTRHACSVVCHPSPITHHPSPITNVRNLPKPVSVIFSRFAI